MANEKIIDVETKVCLKIDRFIDENDFELLFDIEEIEISICEFKTLIEKYEEIHVELKQELSVQYDQMYSNFAAKFKTMTNWLKTAKIELKRRKREKQEKEEQVKKEEEKEKENKIRHKLKIEEKYFRERIDQNIINIAEKGSEFVEDIEKSLNDLKEIVTRYSELFVRIEDAFGDEFDAVFGGSLSKADF